MRVASFCSYGLSCSRRELNLYNAAGVVENESIATPSRSNIRRIASRNDRAVISAGVVEVETRGALSGASSPVTSLTVLHPAFLPASISMSESPIIQDADRSMPCNRAAFSNIHGAGLRHSQ